MRFAVNTVCVIAALLLSASAQAQDGGVIIGNNDYTVVTGSGPYQSLVGGTIVPMSEADEGTALVQLGFTFPYMGQNYTQAWASSNGLLILDPSTGSTCTTGNCFSNRTVPSTSGSIHGFIAPWWDDGEMQTGTSASELHVLKRPGEITFEFRDFGYFSSGLSSARYSFKITLSSTGTARIHYGQHTGSGSPSASTGFENATGSIGAEFLGCGSTCTIASWVADRTIVIGRPSQADVVVAGNNLSSGALVTGADGGTDLELSFAPTLRNEGGQTANNVTWRAFLSTDATLDGADPLVYTSTNTYTLATDATASEPTTITISPAPATGSTYYLLVEALTPTTEASVLNNVGGQDRPLYMGTDLVAKSITGPASMAPGQQVEVSVALANDGFIGDPAAKIEVYLSNDAVYGGTDALVHTEPLDVAGATSVTRTFSFALPGSVNAGPNYLIARLVTGAGVTDGNPANNTVASATTSNVTLPNLELVKFEVLHVDTALPTTVAYIDELARFRVTYKNSGEVGAPANHVGIAISENNRFSFPNDTIIRDEPIPALAAGASHTVEFTARIPLVDKFNNPLVTKPYYLFALVDSFNAVPETSNNDNNGSGDGPILLRAPAPDYTVADVDAPAATAVGEVIPVFRVLRNVGNRAGPPVSVRYYASANEIITADDVPLEILTPTGVSLEEMVTIGAGGENSDTVFLRLPPQMPPGNYYVGILLDEGNVVAELEEANNAIASTSVTAVAEGAMRIVTTATPDGVAGAPYFFRLAAQGGQGAITWSAIDGAQALSNLGLSLDLDGGLRGTPEGAAVVAFTAQAVDSTGRAAIRRLVVRTLPSTSELVITTTVLPPAIGANNSPYFAKLSAAGGVAPFTWSVVGTPLPSGLTLAADGTLAGNIRTNFTPRQEQITFNVVDGVGTRATRTLPLRVVAPGGLVIGVRDLVDGLAGQQYAEQIEATMLSGEPVVAPISWEVMGGSLPAGLVGEAVSNNYFIGGTPTQAGFSRFTLIVRDGAGRSDIADFVLYVHAKRLIVAAKTAFTAVAPEQEVSFQIVAQETALPTRFSLVSGQLPDGLTLSEDGAITGTVTAQAKRGVSTFIVEGVDAIGTSGLGAFGIEVRDSVAPQVGCSSAAGGVTGWLWLLGLPFLLARRKGRAAGALAVTALVAPLAASAQDPSSVVYAKLGPTNQTFVHLASGAQLNDIATSSGQSVTLPFPFKFYGVDYSEIGVSRHGYIVFGATTWSSTTNYGIPHNSSSSTVPQIFMAPWWDSLKLSATGKVRVAYAVSNEAPFQRKVTIEWTDMQYNTTSTTTPNGPFSFQVHLFEGSNKIRYAYGLAQGGGGAVPSGSSLASVGIQSGRDLTNSIAALPCTIPGGSGNGDCTASDYPTNKIIEFVLPADLVSSGFRADTTAYAGLDITATLDVTNVGGRSASSVRTALYLSNNAVLDASDTLLGQTSPRSFETGETVKIDLTGSVPAATPVGDYYLFAKVDSENLISEPSEQNNVSEPFQVRVAPGTADLSVVSVPTPATSSPGATLTVSRSIYNGGSANAEGSIRYTFLLSDNSAVSLSDLKLATYTLAGLEAGELDERTDSVTLPASLSPGRYWLGVCVDFDPDSVPTNVVPEVSEVNNCAGTASGFIVGSDALSIITTSQLAGAAQFAPYGERLEAIGGDGSYAWSVVAGQLPAGMELHPDGRLEGSPGVAGAYSFTARVASGAGATAQERDFSISVTPAFVPLAVAPQELPVAEFAQPFRANLVAVGGKPPYVWSLVDDSRLPLGLSLSSEGAIEGRGNETIELPFRVQVTDSAGASAAAQLSLRVVSPFTLSIATNKLGSAYLNRDYFQRLQAVGGRAPYAFELISFQQLARLPTEAVQPRREKSADTPDPFPEGFGITLGKLEGTQDAVLQGVPAQAGSYSLRLRVTDDTGNYDETTLILNVSYDEALQLTTTWLPDAFVGQAYAVKLSSNADEGVRVGYSLACLEQVSDTKDSSACLDDPAASLPTGLSLGEDGALAGTPEGVIGAEGEVKSFLVRVSDPQGRHSVRALSIKVRPSFSSGGGCAGGGAIPSAAALAMAALAFLRRRSRQ